ncbi:hypothetical protein [Anatilimnocola floriformis]|uniref:hypothetical protein n=1 Tax=Anatilimnocola floriformis TaxID=2948575 RepID=UPI0020C47752|nr:hypothetical protein [Anatilimnocola floriformis]
MTASSARTISPWNPLSASAVWPGLARLWLRGEVGGLLTAVAFGLLLNFALITTFVWPQLLSRQLPEWLVPTMAWIAVVWFWIAGLRAGVRIAVALARAGIPADAESTISLRQAQLDYLKGHLIEAERRLTTLLARTAGDVEAWLLLASVQRRSRRLTEARQSLAKLAELAGSALWADDVQRELAKIQLLEREQPTKPVAKAA